MRVAWRSQHPSRNGACYACGQEGVSVYAGHKTIYPGFHRVLDEEETELREKGANLNPKTFRKPRRATAQQPAPEYRTAAASAPTEKTTAFMLQAAREADQACAAGIKRKRKAHPLHQNGVHASHAMQKVPGYDDRDSRNPEPMHNTGNEVNDVTVMAMGGTAAIYSVARLKEVTEWETDHNSDGRSSRWLRHLRPYSTGCSCQPLLCLEPSIGTR
ncbi:TPA: hypothetical protein ACH3X1_003015 [Trebouxia sp. C0004]